MQPSVYIETSIVSYLVARSTRDVVQTAHQRLTRTWWRTRATFSLFVSELVLQEAAAGDPEAARKRLRALHGLPAMRVTDDATNLADALLTDGGLPPRAAVDAFHIAIA